MDNRKNNGDSPEKALSILLLVTLICATFIGSYYFIFNFIDDGLTVQLRIAVPWFCIIFIITASFLDSFNFSGKRFYDLLYSVYVAALLTSIIVLALPFVIIGAQVSKKVILMNFILLLILLPVWLKLARTIYFHSQPPLRAVFISDDPEEDWVVDKISRNTKKYIIDRHISASEPMLDSIIAEHSAVIIGKLGTIDKECMLQTCASLGKKVLLRPEYTDIMMVSSQTEQFDDLMMISVTQFALTGGQKFLKRTGDIIFSFVGSIISLPIILVCALIIFISDGHNPFFTQKRLTRGGREYSVLKLRTMIPDAEKYTGTVLAEKDDPRITRVGRVLRSMRLDELPQVWNILKGDMSVVGPRPERQFFYEEYDKTLPEFRHRLSVKAGLTGMAQVQGRYSTDPYEKLMLDLMYIKTYSFMLDVKLIIETAKVMIFALLRNVSQPRTPFLRHCIHIICNKHHHFCYLAK